MFPDYQTQNRRHLTHPAMYFEKGFTLIELIVAMAIFAVLTLAGWQVFENLIQMRERTAIKAEQINGIQATYEQLSRDFTQAIPRSATLGSNKESALLIRDNEFHLTRTGVIDPLQMGVSPLERVIYSVQQGQLIRQSFAQVDQTGNLIPIKTVMLDDVSDWTVSAIDDSADRASTTTWPVGTDGSIPTSSEPDSQAFIKLPLAVQITLTSHGQQLKWLFPLVKNLPASMQATPNTNGASAVAQTNPQSDTNANQVPTTNSQPEDNQNSSQATPQNPVADNAVPTTGGGRD
ncbi:type II secretion system minor pseudopilin GspJ [Aquirhabdus sp.]|uniref:type II secretion system minor pseudopilin GspJ n=1 Tax=Aquirhabdus sp. TaxID=2824160 RepID=UPI00396CA5F7